MTSSLQLAASDGNYSRSEVEACISPLHVLLLSTLFFSSILMTYMPDAVWHTRSALERCLEYVAADVLLCQLRLAG